ncbi:hydantoinase/oxoprolinase family protein [Paracandidimonas lactea]|uniref:hydantoinase/oxoprolinase family protein n=1 Tax=Paracandidimonas lactea TaxID=2895524 RepID=UPI001F1BD4C1|nr:hydantoinase/oxoprolinase family protein [Paracandidimonas lactea]
MQPSYRVGIDVGGTFTDLFLLEETSGRTYSHKVSSTPSHPHLAPLRGLQELFGRVGIRGNQVSFVGLGTTVATNALLEWKVAKTGLITTSGFRDLLEIARQKRPAVYDPLQRKPQVPVPRELRLEVNERMGHDGRIITPLSEADVSHAADTLRQAGVDSVAICFLNSYKNPDHERSAAEIVKSDWKDVHVVTSFDVMPEFREYERFVSTAINASLIPVTSSYFEKFSHAISELGIKVAPKVMSSSGGVFSPEMGGRRPIDTLFSGPSGGVSSAEYMGALTGCGDLITFDMGGTSTEVCLIHHGKAQKTYQRSIKGYPIRVTSHDIHTIGAGGSSIAHVDEGGLLNVGPESAGANPGPACYENGGNHVTVTDANVVLGRLNQHYLLDGALAINATRSHEVIANDIAQTKNTGVIAAANAVVALAEANMAQALRVVSVERGIDPSGFTLIALGGAGPLHAASVAREVGMARVLIPRNAGVFCALGVLTKDIQQNLSQTILLQQSDPAVHKIMNHTFVSMEAHARGNLDADYLDLSTLYFERHADVRYCGQNHEITVAVPSGPIDCDSIEHIRQNFHCAHEDLYGYRQPEGHIDIVTLRLDAIVPVPRPSLEQGQADTASLPAAISFRETVFDGESRVRCPVYHRDMLQPGHRLTGPAIIEQMDSTTIIPPGFYACVDPWLNLEITWERA